MTEENRIHEIKEERELTELIDTENRVIVNCWAPWATPCIQMNEVFKAVFAETEARNETAAEEEACAFIFATVQAEALPKVMSRYKISSVPTFLYFHNRRLVRRTCGADGGMLARNVEWVMRGYESDMLRGACETIVGKGEIVVVMKGKIEEAKCGFCRQMIEILRRCGVEFDSFDVLTDVKVREEMKRYANWSTFPMLFARGRLIGGLDNVRRLADEGGLVDELSRDDGKVQEVETDGNKLREKAEVLEVEKSAETKYTEQGGIRERLEGLVLRERVVLFMKGNPNAPRCRFSRRIVEILKKQEVEYGSFDVLSDDDVRQGLKIFSDWPTFPQLYAGGTFVGGLDIVEQLVETGELHKELGIDTVL